MRSRRIAVAGFAIAVAIGFAAILAASIATRSHEVQSLGVGPVFPVGPLHPRGGTVCEQAVSLDKPLTRVRFFVGTFGKPGTPLDVVVRRWHGGAPLARGSYPGGWKDDGSAKNVPLDRTVDPDVGYVEICVTNPGTSWSYVYGDVGTGTVGVKIGARPTLKPSFGTVDGVQIPGDIAMEFVSTHKRSVLSRLPDLFRHASLFRPGFVGPWTYWLLLGVILLAVPLALALALRAALRDPDQKGAAPPPDTPEDTRPAATLAAQPPPKGVATSRGSRD